jgi:hypothetical protein
MTVGDNWCDEGVQIIPWFPNSSDHRLHLMTLSCRDILHVLFMTNTTTHCMN